MADASHRTHQLVWCSTLIHLERTRSVTKQFKRFVWLITISVPFSTMDIKSHHDFNNTLNKVPSDKMLSAMKIRRMFSFWRYILSLLVLMKIKKIKKITKLSDDPFFLNL